MTTDEVTITCPEWQWLAVMTVLLVGLATIPVVVVWQTTPETHVFSGFLVNARDGHSYLAKMRQGYEGAWQYTLAYTAEDTEGLFAFPLYLGLGHVARLIPLPLIVYFTVGRLLGGAVLLVMSYVFVAHLTTEVNTRRWMWLVMSAGGGVGLLAVVLGFESVDLYVPEGYSYFGMLTNPHFPVTQALTLAIMLLVFAWPGLADGWRVALLVVMSLFVAVTAPFGVATLWPLLAAGVGYRWWQGRARGWWAAIPWREGMRVAVVVGSMGVVGLYMVWTLNTNPAVAEWSRQNQILSPGVEEYVFGFGLLLPLAAVGIWWWRGERGVWFWGLVTWLAMTLLLLYAPVSLQRRMMSGVQIAVGPLAGMGVAAVLGWLKQPLVRLLALAGLALGLFNTALFLTLLLSLGAQQQPLEPLTFYTQDERAALDWLAENTASDDVVLSSVTFGNFVPAYSAARVVYGHPLEVIRGEEKLRWVEGYFAGTLGEDDLRALLDGQGVDYVVWGPREQALQGSGPGPDLGGFAPVFENMTVTIYAIP